MPYDQEHHGGPGGDDPRHAPIELVVISTLEALGGLGKTKGLCMDCMALQTAGASLAIFALQQGVINDETGEVHTEDLQALMQAVTDVAMRYVARTVEGNKARKG